MSRMNVSMVTVQGGYIAKQCPVVIQNIVLVPTEKTELPPEAIHRMDAGIEFEATAPLGNPHRADTELLPAN